MEYPSSLGSIMSSIIRSGFSYKILFHPSSPSLAIIGLYPDALSLISSAFDTSFSSSTTSIFLPVRFFFFKCIEYFIEQADYPPVFQIIFFPARVVLFRQAVY